MTENHDRIDRTLEVVLYAPLGFGLFLKDTAPTFINMFVSRGRAEIDRRHDEVQQHMTTARSLGQVTMAYGPPLVRERVSRTVADARRRAEALLGTGVPAPTGPEPQAAPAADAPSFESQPVTRSFPPAPPTPSTISIPRSDDAPLAAPYESPSTSSWSSETASAGDPERSAVLPIPGYDALSASQVVERLVGLAPEELDAVQQYEASHRQRRTILGKIEQLAG
jgi:hypothetical protein